MLRDDQSAFRKVRSRAAAASPGALMTPDGSAAFVIAAANRQPAANDAGSAALLKVLLVYTGPFTIESDKFTTNVEISWNCL